MRASLRKLLSLSVLDSEYVKDKEDKIELINCPLKDMKCKEHLSLINKCYIESEQYRREKDFHRSVETLKSAFYQTMDLKETTCINCTNLFRSTITESMKNIYDELENMPKGIFRKKRYQSSCIKAEITIKEFENIGLNYKLQINEPIENYYKSPLNNSVSL